MDNYKHLLQKLIKTIKIQNDLVTLFRKFNTVNNNNSNNDPYTENMLMEIYNHPC